MTNDQRDPKAGAPGAPRKRPAPTIELKATEIPTGPQAGDPKPEAGADARARFTSSQGSADTKTGAPPQGPGNSMRGLFDRFPSDLSWPAAAAAVAGAVVIFLLGLWAGGVSSGNSAGERLARLEAQLSETANRPTVLDLKSLEEISLRLAKIEAAATRAADPALASRIAALEASAKAAAENSASRERRSDEIAVIAREARSRAEAAATALDNVQKTRPIASDVARADIDALAARIAALEQSARANEIELSKRAAGIDDPKSRLAIAASALRDAVERGNAFSSELAAAKSLAADAAKLAPLEDFAASGLPTAAMLARELSGLTPALAKGGAREPREGGFLDRLQANAGKLVRIRPVGDIAGDDPDQIVARIEVKAAALDIGGALAELAKLPAATRAPAEPWIKKAQARNAAIAAARQFALGALAGIGKSGS